MTEFTVWFNDALKIRFEEVYVQSKQDNLILAKHGKFNILFKAFMNETDDMKAQFLLLE